MASSNAQAVAVAVPRQRRRHIVVDARPLPARVTAPFAPLVRWRRPAAVYGVVLGVVGAAGYVLTASGLLDGALRALSGLGLVAALLWLGWAGVGVHAQHCPGCRWH